MREETHELVDFTEKELLEIKLQIEEWKDTYGSIYITEFEDGETFIWRQLARSEFKKAMEYYEDAYERAEFVCRLCVLDPIEVDFSSDMVAGIPEILTENILTESGFSQDSNKLDILMKKHEEEMNSFENQLSCIIVGAFPHLSIEEVESWTLDKSVWYYSRAIWILNNLHGVQLVPEGAEEQIDTVALSRQHAGIR